MKRIKILLSVLMVAGYSQYTNAQAPAQVSAAAQAGSVVSATNKGNGRISGKVVDASNGEDVPFAVVALHLPGSDKPLDGTVADMEGKFTISKIAEGDYRVIVQFMGYESKIIDVTISEKKETVDLGTIQLAQVVKQLNEVVVEGQRDLIEEKVDRTVYNAENDDSNRGGDATDVLRKVPMLSVDLDGNVSLRGSQNVRVLINNRPSTIAANSIADALKQIPSDLIKSVEVITSPSARYDAEGAAGIINIITKKNTLQGFTLGVDAGVGYRGSNLGLNGSYRTGKMGFTLGGFGRAGYNIRGGFDNQLRTFDPTGNPMALTLQEAETRNQMAFGRYQFGWDYDINKRNYLNASVSYGARNGNMFQDGLLNQTFQNDILVNRSLRDVNTVDRSGTVDVNVGYTHTFETPQRELNILTQYSRNGRTNNFVNRILNEEDLSVLSRIRNLNESYNQETTIQVDYQTPIAKNQMVEFGGKEIMRQVTSDFQYYTSQGDGEYTRIIDPARTNLFNYNQSVTAGYLSYTLTTAKKYSLKAGTRYEYTVINADFQEGQQAAIPSYGALVPSLNLSKRMKDGSMVKAAYNRRLQRPSLQFLNPNIQAANPLNITIGNPNLDPEFTNNFEVGYNKFIKSTSISLNSYFRNSNYSIQSVREVLPGQLTGIETRHPDTILTTFQNIGREDAYGASLFINLNLSNKLTLNGGTDVYYAVLNNNVPNPLYNASNQGFVYSGRLFGTYKLSELWALQGFAFYRGRQVQLQGTQGGFGMYSLNVRKEFANKKGSIGFGAENFANINGFRVNSRLESPLIQQQSTTVFHNMNFKVNFSYRIGKMNAEGPRRRKKSISNDDMKSGGEMNPAAGGEQAAPAQGGGGAPTAAPGGQRPAMVAPGGGQRPAGAPGVAPAGQRPEGTPGNWQRPGQGQNPAQAKPQQEKSEDADENEEKKKEGTEAEKNEDAPKKENQ
jgi:outer membrane receptor protein involved in Fe transport